ncbi:MAG: YbhN family protein [Syntrophales bacterium]
MTLLFSATILLLCLWYIAENFYWYDIGRIMQNVRSTYFFAGVLSVMVFWLIRSYRWSILLGNLNMKVPANELYLYNSISLSISSMTPLLSGEAIKVEWLKNDGFINRTVGYSTLLTERTMDLLVVSMIAILAISNNYSGNYKYLLIAGCLLIIFIIVVGIVAMMKIRRIRKYYVINTIINSVGSLKSLSIIMLLTIAGWFIIGFGWQITLNSIKIEIGFFETLAMVAVVSIVNILSFIPGAIGISEVSISLYLGMAKQMSLVEAQSGALIIRLYGLMVIILGIIHFLFYKLTRITKKNEK